MFCECGEGMCSALSGLASWRDVGRRRRRPHSLYPPSDRPPPPPREEEEEEKEDLQRVGKGEKGQRDVKRGPMDSGNI